MSLEAACVAGNGCLKAGWDEVCLEAACVAGKQRMASDADTLLLEAACWWVTVVLGKKCTASKVFCVFA